MASTQSIRIPVNRRKYAICGDRQPTGWYLCNRPQGHTGRHLFYLRHFAGQVRGVWG